MIPILPQEREAPSGVRPVPARPAAMRTDGGPLRLVPSVWAGPTVIRSVDPMRALRTRTVVAVLAWKLAALALLPVARCACRAVLVADDSATPACCEGGDHGAMCPLKRAAQSAAETDEDRPRMAGCGSLEDALIGLLSLAGFTPDESARLAAPAARGLLASAGESAASFARTPPSPPPRA